MKLLFLITFLFLTSVIIAQNNSFGSNKSIQMEIGSSKHGSGDISGYAINSEFNNFFKSKWSYSIGLGATIHSDSKPIYFHDISGNYVVDSEYRYLIAGFQLTGKIAYSIVRNQKNNFGVKLGTLFRFQSDSSSETETFYKSQNYPFPVVRINNVSPQDTFAVGGIIQLFYNYNISDKLFIGASGVFQTDTSADSISQLSLSFGTKF